MVEIISLNDNVNYSKKLLSAEGNSILVRADGLTIVFDVGRFSVVLEHNLKQLQINKEQITHYVLSHGHKGHVGGLLDLVVSSNSKVLAGEGILFDKYKVKKQEVYSFADVKKQSQVTDAQFELISDFAQLSPNIWVFKTPVCDVDTVWNENHKIIQVDGSKVLDTFVEEVSLCVKTEKGLVVITGCAHRGIHNILRRATEISGVSNVYMIVGGTHIKENAKAIDGLYKIIDELNVQKLAPSHCTGLQGLFDLSQKYPQKFVSFHTGVKLVIE